MEEICERLTLVKILLLCPSQVLRIELSRVKYVQTRYTPYKKQSENREVHDPP